MQTRAKSILLAVALAITALFPTPAHASCTVDKQLTSKNIKQLNVEVLDATSGGGGAVELPPAIQQLVAAKPAILTEDIAARFLVGLGSSDKAYQALRSMVDW